MNVPALTVLDPADVLAADGDATLAAFVPAATDDPTPDDGHVRADRALAADMAAMRRADVESGLSARLGIDGFTKGADDETILHEDPDAPSLAALDGATEALADAD